MAKTWRRRGREGGREDERGWILYSPIPTSFSWFLTYLFPILDAQLLVDLKLHGQAVAVPAKTPHHMMPLLVGETRDRVLDRARQQVAYE
jgi:hypothetical protein